MNEPSLCARMISHAAWSEHTKDMTFGEILAALEKFFTPDEMREAREYLCGRGADQPTDAQ